MICQSSQLPHSTATAKLTLNTFRSEKKQTQPQQQTAKLQVQMMEKKSMGRPSTYVPIKLLRERGYAVWWKNCLQPTLRAEVDAFLERSIAKTD